MTYGEIETIKIVKYFHDSISEEDIKNEIAKKLIEYCFENNLIKFEKQKKSDPYLEYSRIVGTMYVAKKWNEEENK